MSFLSVLKYILTLPSFAILCISPSFSFPFISSIASASITYITFPSNLFSISPIFSTSFLPILYDISLPVSSIIFFRYLSPISLLPATLIFSIISLVNSLTPFPFINTTLLTPALLYATIDSSNLVVALIFSSTSFKST